VKTDERTKAVELPPEPAAPPPPGRANKVCIFTETYYPEIGGGERQAQSLSEALIDYGFQAFVLTRRSHPSFKRVEQLRGIKVYRLPPSGSARAKKWCLLLTSLPALIQLRRQFDLIFVSGFRIIGVPAVLVTKLLRKVCILKADSLGEMSGDYFLAGLAKTGLGRSSLPFRITLPLRNALLKQADIFVAISEEIATELVTNGIDPNNIKIIPNSVDTNRFHPVSFHEKLELRRKLGLPSEGKIFIFTGRLVTYKGLPLLLRVWKEIHCIHPDINLLIVGDGGFDIHNCEVDLKEYVRKNELSDCIRFIGSVHNVHEYLQASDVFVFPTENEAFGISLIEAMACGLPCISTTVGGLKDILEHLQNGLVVEAGDFQQLYLALERLITDSTLAVRLGEAGRQTVEERYSMEIISQKYMNLFQKLASQNGKVS